MSLFKIRREVMQVLNDYSRAAFNERMVLTMYEEHADICAAIGEERVRDEIDRGIKRAVGYAIFDEGDVESFLHMLFERGFDFDSQNPWCKRLLNNKKLKGSAKMGLLDELLN